MGHHGAMSTTSRWTSYLALGDSFSEGLWDVVDDDGAANPDLSRWASDHPHDQDVTHLRVRGWADMLAAHLAARSPAGEVRYANLAIRGRLLPAVVAEQVPRALELRPDLVSLVAGGNDILRPAVDLDRIAGLLEDAVRELRAAGCDVLLATGMDTKDSPLVSATRSRVGVFNAHLWTIAQRHGAHVVDVWGLRALRDWRMWATDRIHLTAEGHARVAQAALVGLGLTPDDPGWDDPLEPLAALPALRQLGVDAAWVRDHAYPWATRRLHGRSSGDLRVAKLPEWSTVRAVDVASDALE